MTDSAAISHDIFHDRAEQSRRNLLVGLLLLNGSVVVVGGLLSLLLARKEPGAHRKCHGGAGSFVAMPATNFAHR